MHFLHDSTQCNDELNDDDDDDDGYANDNDDDDNSNNNRSKVSFLPTMKRQTRLF